MQKRNFNRKLNRFWNRALSTVLALAVILCLMPGTLHADAAGQSDIQITLDGDAADWDYVHKYVVDEDGFSQAAAFVTDDALYIMRDLATLDNYGADQFYIDSDGDHTNGYCNAGIDYMFQGTDLYYYTGEGGAWGWGGSQPKEYFKTADNTFAEYKFPFSSLEKNGSVVKDDIRVKIACSKKDWTILCAYPAGEVQLIKAPSAEEAYQPSDAEPISSFTFNSNGELHAISEETMPGGTVGFFDATGGNGQYRYSFAASVLYGKDNGRFIIDGNRLIVKDRLLSPGTYNLYVKCSSDIRSEKKVFSVEVSKAASTTAISESIFSGREGEWFAVDHNSANSKPNLIELKAVTDGYDLYAYASAEELSDEAEFFISTDTDGEDMTDVWDEADAVGYKVSVNDGTLYKFENDSWASIGTADVYKTGLSAEIRVSLSSLDKSEGEFWVGVMDDNNGELGYLPNVGREMYSITTPDMTKAPEINFDGNDEDWVKAGLNPICAGSGAVGDLYAFRDADHLYAMARIEAGDWSTSYAVSTNFLVNADDDPKTGYQHPKIKISGADFLIQDWKSNTTDPNDFDNGVKNVEFFSGTTSGWSKIGDEFNGFEYKKYVISDDGSYVTAEWCIPISVMESVLGSVASDLYIAVDKSAPDLQTGTLPGTAADQVSFALVPKYNVGVKISVGDESCADWDTISKKSANTSEDSLYNLEATRSQDRLYTLVTSEEGTLNTVNVYYISTGKDTGYDFSTYRKIDYIVRDAKLFPVVADNTIDEENAVDVWMNYYHDSIEMQLYLEDIGNPEKIEIGWRGVDGTHAIPADGLMSVSAKFEFAREAGYYYPTEDFASFGNPYKGWVGWAGEFTDQEIEKTSSYRYEYGNLMFDRSAVYLAVRWSEYEPVKGKYDFEGIKRKYNLDFWKAHGVRINLRFVMDNPEGLNDGESRRMDIPKWLYDELVEETNKKNIKNPGTFYVDYANLGGAGFSPNYNSELLIEYHDKVIEQLAKDFDDNKMTAFVQIGSLGHWAEMHTWPEGTGEFPDPSTCDRYMESYTKYFHNVKLGLRKPYPYAVTHKFGLFNDIFGAGYLDGQGTATFLSYINDGDVDMPHASAEEVAASRMPDFWKYNYSGGEFSDGDPTRHLNNDKIVETINEIRYTHVSWLGPCSPCNMESDEIFAVVNEANILAAQKAMGYNFALEKVQILGNVTAGQNTPVSFVVNNEGVAPFYYDWPIEFSLIDNSGKVVYKETVTGGIKNWMPGRTQVNTNLNVSNSVPSGEYTLAIAIADRDTKEPAIRLAVRGGRDDLRYPLYKISLTSTGSGKDDPKPATPDIGGGAAAGAGAGATASDSASGVTTPVTPAVPGNGTANNPGGNNQGNSTANNANAGDNENENAGETVENTETGKQNEQTVIENGETALADGIGGDDGETGEPDAAVVTDTANTGLIAAIMAHPAVFITVLILALAAAGYVIYRKMIRKGGQVNE